MEHTQVQVEILVGTWTAQYGTLHQGALLRTSEAFAAHLVDDCRAARYLNAGAASPVQESVQTSAQAKEGGAEVKLTKAQQKAADRAARDATAKASEPAASPADPYAHLGTLVAVVPGAADEAVQTSAQSENQEAAAADAAPPAIN